MAAMSSANYQHALRDHAYAFAQASEMREVLSSYGDLSDWPAFAESWNDLGLEHG